MSAYTPKHFILQELVTPKAYADLGQRAWQLLSPDALYALDQLRERYGPILVNTWHRGGVFQDSGFRDHDTTTGALYSQHRYGRAFDCKFERVMPAEVQQELVARPNLCGAITAIEDTHKTPTWLHFDCRRVEDPTRLLIVA